MKPRGKYINYIRENKVFVNMLLEENISQFIPYKTQENWSQYIKLLSPLHSTNIELMICIDHRSVTLAQGLLLDVEAGTRHLLSDRFNGK